MKDTKIELQVIKEKLNNIEDAEIINNALYKDYEEVSIATKIILSGKYQKAYCGDIFANIELEKSIEIFDDYIAVYNFYGVKHFYNELGEFKHEHFPELNCL